MAALTRPVRRGALALLLAATALPVANVVPAAAEQASSPASAAAGEIDAGGLHSCAAVPAGALRCWGFNGAGQLGYPGSDAVGDDETPAAAGAVPLGGRAVTALAAGDFHTCALLDDGSVRCWGFGGDGRLGYGDTADVRDPAAAGPVDLGATRTAQAISAGEAHTCAVLDDGSVRCWGFGGGGFPIDGRLGYGNTANVGDDETPASAGPVALGAGARAVAISAGGAHTCALLADRAVKCWGRNDFGQLGLGHAASIGDRPTTTPDRVAPVDVGGGRRALGLSAGGTHTCAVFDDGTVRCWGNGANGRLGYGNEDSVGDRSSPASAGPVALGAGRPVAISAGAAHTCALLDGVGVRCWGLGAHGRLGYGSQRNVGDDEPPAAAGVVDLGAGRGPIAVSAGMHHTCARLDDGGVRCWGRGGAGRLGYCDERTIGDDEPPGSVGPVQLGVPDLAGQSCPSVPSGAPTPAPPPEPPRPAVVATSGPFATAMRVVGARVVRRARALDLLATISGRASGSVRVQLHAAGRRHRFGARIDERAARIRFRRRIPAAQARLGTGIVTLAYPGDADTRPLRVRLRAAAHRAALRARPPTLAGGWLRASGTVSRRARGVVRVRIDYVVAGRTRTFERGASIAEGRWSLSARLPPGVRAELVRRTGAVQSYTLFTGYLKRRVRGEMRSHRVLDPP